MRADLLIEAVHKAVSDVDRKLENGMFSDNPEYAKRTEGLVEQRLLLLEVISILEQLKVVQRLFQGRLTS